MNTARFTLLLLGSEDPAQVRQFTISARGLRALLVSAAGCALLFLLLGAFALLSAMWQYRELSTQGSLETRVDSIVSDLRRNHTLYLEALESAQAHYGALRVAVNREDGGNLRSAGPEFLELSVSSFDAHASALWIAHNGLSDALASMAWEFRILDARMELSARMARASELRVEDLAALEQMHKEILIEIRDALRERSFLEKVSDWSFAISASLIAGILLTLFVRGRLGEQEPGSG